MRCSLPTPPHPPPPTHTQFDFFQEFFFDSLLFEYEVLRNRIFFFLILTTWCSWGFLDLWFDSAFVWEIIWSLLLILQVFLSFLSFSFRYSHCMYIIPLWLSHSSWTFWGFCFWFLFLFAFQFWKFLLTYFQASWFSSPPCPVCWWAHQIHYSFLLSATSCLLMSLPFNFLLKARHDILDIKNQVK